MTSVDQDPAKRDLQRDLAANPVYGIPVVGRIVAAWAPGRRRVVGGVLVVLLVVAAAGLALDLGTDAHAHFKAKKSDERFVWSESYALYGCFAAVAFILLVRLLSLILRRREGFYDAR